MPSLPPCLSGQSLESLLNFAHQLYLDRGLAVIELNGTRGKFIKRAGKLIMVPAAGGSAPDYYGSVSGRTICFDAKRVSLKTGWNLHRDSLHQFHTLQRWALVGKAVCWFAIEQATNSRLWLFRVTGLENPFELPGLRFNAEPREGLLRLERNSDGWFDWLAVVREIWLV